MEEKQLLAIIGMLVLMGIFFTSTHPIPVLLSGIPLAGILIWSLIRIQRSNIDEKLKQQSMIVILVIIAVIGRMAYALFL